MKETTGKETVFSTTCLWITEAAKTHWIARYQEEMNILQRSSCSVLSVDLLWIQKCQACGNQLR